MDFNYKQKCADFSYKCVQELRYAAEFKWSLTCLAEKWQMKPTPYTRCAIAFLVSRNNRYKNQRREEELRGKKRQRCRELVVPATLCLQDSAEHPSLSAGVKYRKRLLYNSKSQGSFFFPCPCLCGWLQALSLFYGHMHVQGITARIFKETGPYSKQSGPHYSSWQHQISREIWDSNTRYIYGHITLLTGNLFK